MDTLKYRALLAVDECGSLNGAAEQLGYTQPGVAQMIKSMEEELGLTLLMRTNKGALLTREARRLLPMIIEQVDIDEKIRQTSALMTGLEEGEVAVGCYTSVGIKWIPQILHEFRKRSPNIRVSVSDGDKTELEKKLREGRIDLAINTWDQNSEFEADVLAEDEYMALLPEDNPLCIKRAVTIDRLLDYPVIMLKTGESADTERIDIMKESGIRWKAVYTTSQYEAMANLVAAGLGVAITTRIMQDDETKGVVVKPLAPGRKRKIALCARSFEKLSPAAAAFVDCVHGMRF